MRIGELRQLLPLTQDKNYLGVVLNVWIPLVATLLDFLLGTILSHDSFYFRFYNQSKFVVNYLYLLLEIIFCDF